MATAEKIFRVFSLLLLVLGFVVSVEGTDIEKLRDATTSISEAVNDAKMAEEVNKLNQGVELINGHNASVHH